MVKTTLDYEREFLLSMLGGAAVPSDTLNDLRYKFYKGVVEGSIVIGGGASVMDFRVPKIGSFLGPHSITGSGGGSSAFAAGDVPATQYIVEKQITIDQIGFRVSTLEAGMNAKALLYKYDGDGYPAAKVIDSGPLSCAATGDVFTTALPPVVLTPGIYYGVIRSNAGNTVRFMCAGQNQQAVTSDSTANIWQAPGYVLINPGTYAAPTDPITAWSFTFGPTNSTFPLLYLRRSA